MLAKKSYGQHFLHQARVIDRIAKQILKHESQNVLEVGPGKGAITLLLNSKVNHFLAVEADKEMVAYLDLHFPELNGKIIQEDILKFALADCFGGEEFLLCGNFPYNISSQIVFATLKNTSKINTMVGMFQKEMAQRICAKEGSKTHGILSVLTPLMYDAHICFDISKHNFSPPPKVTSAVVEFKRKEKYLSFQEFEKVRKLVKAAFQFRRKTLRNNLKNYVTEQDQLSDVYFNQRPEDISALEFLRLSKTLM